MRPFINKTTTRKSIFPAFFILLFFGLPTLLTSQIHYVKVNGTGDGSSWENASGDLQAVIDSAGWGNTIYLAEGTYYPTTCTSCDSTDREASFLISQRISLFGGFPDTGNPNFDDRNIESHPTIVSGDIGITGDNIDNSFHVFRIDPSSGNNLTTFNGLIISNGNADSLSSNPNGAGILSMNTPLKLNKCTLSDNNSTGNGAAVYGDDKAADFTFCTFENNTASSGGAIFIDSDLTSPVTNCIFKNNSATTTGGAIHFASEAHLDIFGSLFHENTAVTGGAIYAEKPMIDTYYSGYVEHCTFVDNTASSTGSILHVSNLTDDIRLRSSICWSNQLPAFSLDSVSGYYSDIEMSNCLTDAIELDSMACCDIVRTGFNSNCYFNSPDPFADYSNNDFTLLSTSVATNKGYFFQSLGGFCNYTDDEDDYDGDDCIIDDSSSRNRSNNDESTSDLLGNPRIRSYPDIGAYEFYDPNDSIPLLYVNKNATGLNNGLTWNDAFTAIEDAFNQARNYFVDAIWIAEGTYERSPNSITFNGQSFSFNGQGLNSTYLLEFRNRGSVGIYGGFPNSGEPTFADRDWDNHPTIISGEAGIPDSLGDNFFTLFRQDYLRNSNITLDGLTFTGARNIALRHFNDLEVHNSSFTDNNIGMFVDTRGDYCSGEGTIHNCDFNNNNTAISVDNESELNIYDSQFTNNQGAISLNDDAILEAYTSNFFDNHIIGNGGAIFGDGIQSIELDACRFKNNSATDYGGAIYLRSYVDFMVTNSMFAQNNSTQGGVFASYRWANSEKEFTNCTLYNNTATEGGSVFHVLGNFGNANSLDFQNSILWDHEMPFSQSSGITTNPITFTNTLSNFNSCSDISTTSSCNDLSIFDSLSPFVDLINLDLQLHDSSFAINHGNTDLINPSISYDLAGNTRVLGISIDIGAYEFVGNNTFNDDYDNDGFTVDLDCNDFDPSISPNSSEVIYNGIDDDCNPTTLDDDLDQDGYVLADDCDDNDPTINPTSQEIPYNGIDDDCSEYTMDDDYDQDGFGLADDCNDNNPLVNQDAPEVPYNGIDDDCNEATPDDDIDQDGFGIADDCDDNNPLVNINGTEILYNGIDDDCNALTLDDDLDQDGFGIADDCDDNNPLVNMGTIEIPYNGIDDDCNETTLDDDLDQDGFGLADDCNDYNPMINTGYAEVPYNGIDDDCDEMTLDDDLDQDGFGIADDCDDNNPLVNQGTIETPYNGIDDDCDEATLDDDLDQDGFNLADDCDDQNPAINLEAVEIANNDIDEDCDGEDLIISSNNNITTIQPQVFPNPTSNLLQIVFPSPIEGTYELNNLNGKLIMQGVLQQELMLNLASQAQGVYILSIKIIDTGVWTERIVKL